MGSARVASPSRWRGPPASELGATAHFLPLEAITEPGHIVKALADSISFTIDLHISGSISEQTQLFDRLRAQPMVLVLDNLEHLPGAGQLITDMAAALPDLTVIGTSRERVGISAERVIPVHGLEPGDDALALLVERAQQAGATIDPNSPAASLLVELVGGMPLAIEMAAAWTPLLTLEEIAEEISSSLDFLASAADDISDRHRSVRAVFEQTWQRLDDDLRSGLAAMALFVAPFTREAAEAITGASLATLAKLNAASLLRREALSGNYSLHPLLREFAAERLEDRDRLLEGYARHHLDHLTARRERLSGRDQIAARDELVEELDHLRFALEWGMQHLPDDEMCDAVGVYGDFVFLHSWVEQAADMHHLAEVAVGTFGAAEALRRRAPLLALGHEALAQENFLTPDEVDELVAPVLANTTFDDGLIHALALTVRGITETGRSNYASSLEWFERAAVIKMTHNPLFSAVLGSWHGWAHLQLGDAVTARVTLQRALAVADGDGHEIARAYLLSKLGVAADGLGEHRLAAEYHHEGREIFVKAGDLGGQGYTLSRLSWTHYKMESWDLARRYGLEGLEKFEEINHRWGIAVSNGRIGLAEVKLGSVSNASTRFLETLRLAEESGLPDQLHYGVIGIGLALHAAGDDQAAARLLVGSCESERNPYRDLAESVLAEIESALGEDFAELKTGASTLDLNTLVREARHHARSLVGAE